MNRRRFIGSLTLATLAAATATPGQADAAAAGFAPDHPLQAAWTAWKGLCLMGDGRVVDGFQNGASHSEGQGYGLALAALFGDLAAADSIIRWTETNLAVRPDALLAWRWQADAQPQVRDRNNASDGDLFYAWGLMLLAARQNRADLKDRATRIAADLLRLCVADHPDGSGRPVLLPGAAGFRRDDGLVVNPSYYMPLALRALGSATGLLRLVQLAEAGQHMINTLASAGPMPDWILLTATGTAPPPEGFSARSGYEAVRVALFALWSGASDSPAITGHAARALPDASGTPTVIDPATGAVLERSSHAGYAAVSALASCVAGGGVGALMPPFTTDQPYYPATLHLMALVAQADNYPRCVPI